MKRIDKQAVLPILTVAFGSIGIFLAFVSAGMSDNYTVIQSKSVPHEFDLKIAIIAFFFLLAGTLCAHFIDVVAETGDLVDGNVDVYCSHEIAEYLAKDLTFMDDLREMCKAFIYDALKEWESLIGSGSKMPIYEYYTSKYGRVALMLPINEDIIRISLVDEQNGKEGKVTSEAL